MDDARSWYISGMSLQAENRHQETLLAFEQSLVLDPGNAGAWNGKGLALAHLFKNAEAIQAFDCALNKKAFAALKSRAVVKSLKPSPAIQNRSYWKIRHHLFGISLYRLKGTFS